MKLFRSLFCTLLLCGVGLAQTVVTSNIGLTVPDIGKPGYAAFVNTDLQLVDNVFGTAGPKVPGFSAAVLNGDTVNGGTVNAGLLKCTGLPTSCLPTLTFSNIGGQLALSQLAVTGDGSSVLTAGSLVGATGAVLCKDAFLNATTQSCPAAAGGASLTPAAAQAFVMNSGFSLGINVLEDIVFAADYAPSSSGGVNEAFTTGCRNSGRCHVIAGLGTIAACNITIPTNGVLSGMGWTLTVLQCGTAGSPVIANAGDKAIIEEVTTQHSSNPSTGGDGIIVTGDRVTIRHVRSINNQVGLRLGTTTFGSLIDVIAEQANGDCVVFDTTIGSPGANTSPMQWIWRGGLAQKCGGWGASMTNSSTVKWTGPRIIGGVHFFANNLGGIKVQNTSSGRIDNTFILGNVFSQNNGDNIFLDANGHNMAVETNYIEQSGGNVAQGNGFQPQYGFNAATGTTNPSGVGHGIDITSNCDPSGTTVLVEGNRFFQTSDDGVMSQCAGTTVVNNSFYDPGFSHTTGANNLRAGVAIEASQMLVTGNFFQQGGTHSVAAIDISNSADKPSMVGNTYGTGYTDASFISESTFPANGFREWVGNILMIQHNVAPSLSAGQCTGINGSIWTRVDATGGLYLCVNGAWIAK